MTINFFLHGGDLVSDAESMRHFVEAAGVQDGVVLIVPFALEVGRWEGLVAAFRQLLVTCGACERVKCELPQHSDIYRSLREAQLIVFSGGDERLLRPRLAPADLVEAVTGKTVIAASAGVNVLAIEYFSNDRGGIEKGMGILPIKTICHYSEDKRDRLESLRLSPSPGELVPLPERSFVSFAI